MIDLKVLIRRALVVLLPMLICVANPSPSSAAPVSQKEAQEIGIEAYTYLFPLVLLDITRKVLTNVDVGQRPGAGPANMFIHMRAFPTADFRDVVRPNFDTLYSSAWLDLTKEPMILTAPDTGGRYYLLPMLDMWSDVFASPGSRTSGTKAAHFAIVPPQWRGTLPNGVSRIESPTTFVWIIGRTQTNGIADYKAVHAIQDGYKITPLSLWGQPYQAPKATIDSKIDMKTDPVVQATSMSAEKFFNYGLSLMKANPGHLTDWSIIARMNRLGLVPGQSTDFSKLSSNVRAGLKNSPSMAIAQIKAKIPSIARVVNGWQLNTDTMGVYGNYYLKRAIVALIGLGANQPEDAVYPMAIHDADGNPFSGKKNYVLHFEKDELPPAEAFWSITMYDAQGYQVANSINRFAIGDRDSLKFNSNGSLDIYIQHLSPGAEKESNWLPSPADGGLGITMRIYGPKPAVLNGTWAPPAIRSAK